jgi:MEDS: MEthanogen/methylotroph, DcmR Sensory domain
MASDTPSTRIDRVGGVATWGAHIALFCETKDDLLDTLVPYCRTGLERNESCLWFVAEPYLTMAKAWQALRDAVDSVDRYQADGRIEIDSANDWFARAGAVFDGDQVAAAWYEKLASVRFVKRPGRPQNYGGCRLGRQEKLGSPHQVGGRRVSPVSPIRSAPFR